MLGLEPGVRRPRASAEGSGSRSGARPWGGGSGGGGLPPVSGSGRPLSSSVRPALSVPQGCGHPGLGEDAATHVALEVGPRTLRRLSGCPLSAPTPWGCPLRPPGVPPSAASAPTPPPVHVSGLASPQLTRTPPLCPRRPPLPASVSVCLSGSPLKPVAGACVCGRGWRRPVWELVAPSSLGHPPDTPQAPPLTSTGRNTHTHAHAHTHTLTTLGFPSTPQGNTRAHTRTWGSDGGRAASAVRG